MQLCLELVKFRRWHIGSLWTLARVALNRQAEVGSYGLLEVLVSAAQHLAACAAFLTQQLHAWAPVEVSCRLARSRISDASSPAHCCALRVACLREEVSMFLTQLDSLVYVPLAIKCDSIVPWYFPYPPCTFSCTPFCTSRSRIRVLLGLSYSATFKIWVALIQSSARRRMQ